MASAETLLLLVTEGEGVAEVVSVLTVPVVAATEGEGVVETVLLAIGLLLVVAATDCEGEGVAETTLLSVQWGLQKRNRVTSVKIMVMFVRMLAHFTI